MNNDLTNPLEIRGVWPEFNEAYLHTALCEWYRTKAMMPERDAKSGWDALRLALLGA